MILAVEHFYSDTLLVVRYKLSTGLSVERDKYLLQYHSTFLLFQDISEITHEKLFLGDLVEDGGKYFYSSANVFHVLEEAGTVRQGPSKTDERELPNRLTADRVYAYPCRSWPVSLQEWMVRKRKHGWPSPHLMMTAMSKGCFLVPVGHKLSDNSDLEWRLSPSLAERMLMFSLSETHIKCYVLLKHIVKYIVKPILGPSLTSFHCKTAVLTLAERTPWDMWTPDRLMECMDMCLGLIISWCRAGWCPNYLLPRENLFAGRMNTQKLADLMEILLTVYYSRWRILLILDDWGLGEALELAFTGCPYLLSNNVDATASSLVPGVEIECMSNERYFEKALRRTEKAVESFVCHQWPVELAIQAHTQGAKSLYLAKKRMEVTSPAIVVLNAFLDSSDLPKEGLSGLLWKFFWRDALIIRYLDVLFVIYS